MKRGDDLASASCMIKKVRKLCKLQQHKVMLAQAHAHHPAQHTQKRHQRKLVLNPLEAVYLCQHSWKAWAHACVQAQQERADLKRRLAEVILSFRDRPQGEEAKSKLYELMDLILKQEQVRVLRTAPSFGRGIWIPVEGGSLSVVLRELSVFSSWSSLMSLSGSQQRGRRVVSKIALNSFTDCTQAAEEERKAFQRVVPVRVPIKFNSGVRAVKLMVGESFSVQK